MSTRQLHIATGLPSAGKTVWARQWRLEAARNRAVFDRNDLTTAMGHCRPRPCAILDQPGGAIVTAMIAKGITSALALGQDVAAVGDSSTQELSWLIQIGLDYEAHVTIHQWTTTPEEAIARARNANRPGSERRDHRDIWECHRYLQVNEQMLSSIRSRANEVLIHE